MSPRPALAWEQEHNSRGQAIAWRSASMQVQISYDSAPRYLDRAQLQHAVTSAIDTWNTAGQTLTGAPCTALAVDEGRPVPPLDAGTTQDATDGVSSVYFYEAWNDRWDPNAVALTWWAYRKGTGQIVESEIAVQATSKVRWNTDDRVEDQEWDFQGVLTHELGHFVGFAHTLHEGATMFDGSHPGPPSMELRDLSRDDINAACDLYPLGLATAALDKEARALPGCSLSPLQTNVRPSSLLVSIGALVSALTACRISRKKKHGLSARESRSR